ncbi:MAG: signal peptide peptidase SppA [Proteobacteria bacterium]|nr:MAG: signal peptide peptidase SppA [Pseudomonadota bacterium]
MFIRIFAPIKWLLALINNYFKSFVFLLILYLIFSSNVDEGSFERANLARIDIHGAIMEADKILGEIQKAKEDEDIKGVLLHVDSPGGALAPSVEISYAIKELQKSKPVVAYGAGTMASGSYYASIWSDKIYANPGAFIGSIGVIFQSYNVEDLAKKIGIKEQTIKAGRFKEAGTFMREWSEDERKSLKTLIDNSYDLFVNDVAKARDLNISDKEKFADARVFLAKNAQKEKLIDHVGILWNAQNELIKLSKVKKAKWKKKDKFDRFLEEFTNESAKGFIKIFYGLKAY